MTVHIAIDYYKDTKTTYCGAAPKNLFCVQDTINALVVCKECIDLHYQKYPNCCPIYNPYFEAGSLNGNEKLRAIRKENEN